MIPSTFEEWEQQQDPTQPSDEQAAWNAGCMSRDAEIADLKRQLAERGRIAYPIIGIPSAKDFARQCDPFEPDSETTTGTCAHWRDKVEKVFAQMRSIFDAYVQEKVDAARAKAFEQCRQLLLAQGSDVCANGAAIFAGWRDDAANRAKVKP